MKDNVFTVVAVLVFLIEVHFIEYFLDKIEDKTWFICIAKIVIMFLVLIVHMCVTTFFANLFGIEWKGL